MIVETPVECMSEGAVLRGLLLTPTASERRLATVIVAHGSSAAVNMVAIEFTRSFCRTGFAECLGTAHDRSRRRDGSRQLRRDETRLSSSCRVRRAGMTSDEHFGLCYHPGNRFDEVVTTQNAFLKEQLLDARPIGRTCPRRAGSCLRLAWNIAWLGRSPSQFN
jgi:hypothetical protein